MKKVERGILSFEELESSLNLKGIKIDNEKAAKWLSTGAQPTETVRTLFKKNGIME